MGGLELTRRITVEIPIVDAGSLTGDLVIPPSPRGLVLFAHGSGSSRTSPRNRLVANKLNAAAYATLLFDLLTKEEETVDQKTGRLRFDIGMLASRLVTATEWIAAHAPDLHELPIGYFGASTGAAAAIAAASSLPGTISAIVSRGGRPDLAGPNLERLETPTLLMVGGRDRTVIGLNDQAMGEMRRAPKQLLIIPGASHLFEEPGALERVSELAIGWLNRHMVGSRVTPAPRRDDQPPSAPF